MGWYHAVFNNVTIIWRNPVCHRRVELWFGGMGPRHYNKNNKKMETYFHLITKPNVLLPAAEFPCFHLYGQSRIAVLWLPSGKRMIILRTFFLEVSGKTATFVQLLLELDTFRYQRETERERG